VLITLGGDGSYAYCAESGEEYREGAVKTEVVSTVGAGDSFAAAWLTCFLEGKTIPECMKKAAEISGFVVGHTEAIPKY
jgi:sugar/nucleoside kinase (ribokinase family)